MARFSAGFTKGSLKQLRSLPKQIQDKVLQAIGAKLAVSPQIADGKHIKKLTEGYRLRVGSYRVFYYLESRNVIITSIIRRTSTTY